MGVWVIAIDIRDPRIVRDAREDIHLSIGRRCRMRFFDSDREWRQARPDIGGRAIHLDNVEIEAGWWISPSYNRDRAVG